MPFFKALKEIQRIFFLLIYQLTVKQREATTVPTVKNKEVKTANYVPA